MPLFPSDNLLTTLGVQPIQAAISAPDEDRPGAPHVALISYGLWQRRFGVGAPDVELGRLIRLDNEDYQIIGILPEAGSCTPVVCRSTGLGTSSNNTCRLNNWNHTKTTSWM